MFFIFLFGFIAGYILCYGITDYRLKKTVDGLNDLCGKCLHSTINIYSDKLGLVFKFGCGNRIDKETNRPILIPSNMEPINCEDCLTSNSIIKSTRKGKLNIIEE